MSNPSTTDSSGHRYACHDGRADASCSTCWTIAGILPGALRESMLRHWWDTQTDDTDQWDDLTVGERDAVAENSYVDVHLAALLDALSSPPP